MICAGTGDGEGLTTSAGFKAVEEGAEDALAAGGALKSETETGAGRDAAAAAAELFVVRRDMKGC